MAERTTRQREKSFAIRANLGILRLAHNWLKVVLALLAIYVTLPFAAPTLMEIGYEGPSRVLYTLYSPFCHQFAFRSFFLYGDQPVYPRANTGTDWTPFEAYVSGLPDFAGVSLDGFDLSLITSARGFLGNDQMGYKLALCERDIVIYISLLLGGLIYALPRVRRRLRPVPLWLYVILGLGPIGLDGFSQLLGYPPFNLWPPRETLPIFRVVTGALFGLTSAWLVFPHMDISMRDTAQQIKNKLTRAGIAA